MSANVINWHAKAGRGLGIGAIDYTPARIGQTLHIPCSRGHRVDVEIKARMRPEMLGKKLLHAGWTIGNHLLCPKHSKKTPKAQDAPQQETEDMPAVEATPHRADVFLPPVQQAIQRGHVPATRENAVKLGILPPDQPTSTDAARTAKRAAMQWLDEAFDVAKGCYRAGVTDETIAKETGLAPAKIKELREEFYGAMKEPSELGACRAEFEALRKHAITRMDEMQAQTKAFLGEIAKDCDAAVARIEALAKANGWRS